MNIIVFHRDYTYGLCINGTLNVDLSYKNNDLTTNNSGKRKAKR